MYRRQNWKETDQKSADMIEEIEKNHCNVLSVFIDSDTNSYKEGTHAKIVDVFKERVYKIIQKHQNMLNSNFEMILNHLYPIPQVGNFTQSIDIGFSKSFEEIKKFSKLTKYQMPEYIKTHNFKTFDIICASFDPDKKQYNFIKDVLVVKEYELKTKFEEAFGKIIEAQNILVKSISEMFSFRSFMIKSGIFSDKQLVNSLLNFKFKPEQAKSNKMWGISIEEEKLQIDLTEDPFYGDLAKRYLSKTDQVVDFDLKLFKRK